MVKSFPLDKVARRRREPRTVFNRRFIFRKALSSLSLGELYAAISDTSGREIVSALGFTALSYLALTGYDATALQQVAARSPYWITALASFASYAFSFNLGFPLITGAAVRLWVYSRAKITAVQVANITFIAGLTFWLGIIASLGFGLVLGAAPLAMITRLPAFLNFTLGAAALAAIAGYCVWTSRGKRHLNLRGRILELPGARATLMQTALGVIDIGCAASALYVLLPQGSALNFSAFLAIYAVACLLGIVSHAPGGIGVFEATIMHSVPTHSQERMLASLLLFRAIYYFGPLLLACGALAYVEGPRRWSELWGRIIGSVRDRDS